MEPAYKKVLLKLSGETLMAEHSVGLDAAALARVAKEIEEVCRLGVQMGIVIGGGNFFRGATLDLPGMDRVNADYMGMLATIINGLALNAALNKAGVRSCIISAMEVWGVVPLFTVDAARKALDNNEVVIFTAGTGNPFFTTDTAAALRGIQIKADVLLKATKVDGVYNKDPKKDSNAAKFEQLDYSEALRQNLKFMDAAAISMCRDNGLPIVVFDFLTPGNLKKIITGEEIGTIVRE
jgi:uridylate kinase